ncbi:MAG: ATP-binding protein [Sulfuritalea sp.]|nr:ATP-binding protein [Sulfuritalea sp.]
MANFTTAESSSNLHLNFRRTLTLRWWLLAAVAIAVSSAPTLLDISLPQLSMFAVAGLMAGFNAYLQWRAPADKSVGASELFGQLCVDLMALAILLYLSGGAANPLISLLLVPVAVAALSLPGRFTAAVALLAVGLYSLLMWQFLPLSVGDAERAARLHLAGMWLTFVVSATMIAWFVARMTASIRERDSRLAAAREQALRDERVVALGALAAGAAHELGTPLATIAVVVGELERETFPDAEVRDDLALIREQVTICKGIISGMAARAGALRPEQLQLVDAGAWLQSLRARWHTMRPRAASRLTLEGIAPPPAIAVEPTLEQAVASLLNNAADASDAEIDIRLVWDDAVVRVLIRDNGPGFPDDVLRQAGRIPLSSHGAGAGIGLLLAFSAIERLGGRIFLDNPPGGGGRVSIELPVAGRGGIRQGPKVK